VKINPSDLNIQALPSVSLEDRDRLPRCPGIYFAIDSLGQVQYIGRSVNLNQRWKYHHRQSDLDACQGVQIHHLEISSPELLPEVEAALIEWFEPRLNGQTSHVPRALNRNGGRKCKRPTDRVNYKLDSDLREILQVMATREGRNEGAQVEQLILFYAAAESLNNEGEPLSFGSIRARVGQIWGELLQKAPEGETDERTL
jgi:hypothetical protein